MGTGAVLTYPNHPIPMWNPIHQLLYNQSQLVTQLQLTNNNMQTQMLDTQDDVANVASQAMSAVVQTFLMNMPALTGH